MLNKDLLEKYQDEIPDVEFRLETARKKQGYCLENFDLRGAEHLSTIITGLLNERALVSRAPI